MPPINTVRAVIFDVDETLLNNHPAGLPGGLHEVSRLRAAHEVGKLHGSAGLMNLTMDDAAQAFRDAKVHTLDATVWQMLVIAGEVSDVEPKYDHPLLREITVRKELLHEAVLHEYGEELPGASDFVRALHSRPELHDYLAIASTSSRRDIDLFFAMTGLDSVFPDNKIISRERLTHAKPHPEAFNLAFQLLGLPDDARANTLAFEDDPRGIMAAKAAGLYTVAITSRFSRDELSTLSVAPDYIIDSYATAAQALGM